MLMCSHSDTCPQEYTALSGTILSPGYAGYRNNMFCVIIIRLNNTAKRERRFELYVDEFRLESKYDYLVITSTKFTGTELQKGLIYTGTDELLSLQNKR